MKITSRLTSITSKVLDRIEAAAIPIIALPWHGSMVCVKIRELNQTQILACGDFSLIETFQDKVRQKKKKIKRSEVMAYAEAQHAIARAALMSPTYDEIMDRIGKGKDIDKKKLELEELKKSLESCPPGPQRSTMEEEIDSYKIWIDLILPTDFLAALIAYCLGVNKSDIKKVSEKMLLNLAIMAVKGNDNPHNHIDGDLTPFNLYDIDFRSWLIYADYLEEQKNGTAKPEI